MGLGLNNMTGQQHAVDTVIKLDHSISYYSTYETETAQAESENKYHQSGILLPLLLETPDDIVLTYYHVFRLIICTKKKTAKKVFE